MPTYQIGINDTARDKLLKHLEESGRFSANAYLDTEGIPTIGWGNTTYADGRRVRMGDKITQQEADALYNSEITRHVKELRASPNYNRFNPNQQAALESFAYNVGPYFLRSNDFKTISRAILAGDVAGVRRAMPLYRNGGVLDNRRRQELALFDTPWNPPAQTQPASTGTQPNPTSNRLRINIIPDSILNLQINR